MKAIALGGSSLGGLGPVLGTVGVLAVTGFGLRWLDQVKQSNATLSSTGDSTNGTINNVASNLPNSTTTNNSTLNGTDQSWWNKASGAVSSGLNSASNWWSNQSFLDKALLTTAGLGIGIPAATSLLTKAIGYGGNKSNVKSDNKNTNTNTTTNNNNPSTSSHNEFQFENENEVDYTPSSFHNFVPSINVNTSPVKPVIEINPKSAIFIPYERGHKSVPKTRNNRFDYDWMFKNVRSPGFSNI